MGSGRADRKRFAAKLRSLRDLNGRMTQKELHYTSGVPLDLIQNYEQEKSLAKGEQRLAMAKALGVPKEVLTGYDIRNANEGFNYLLELHHIFGGWASMTDGKPAWR